jgi:hypothetical protein
MQVMYRPKPYPITLERLHFYFDGQSHDLWDQSSYFSKHQTLLHLKEKLFLLDEAEFQETVRAIEIMIEKNRLKAHNNNRNASELDIKKNCLKKI